MTAAGDGPEPLMRMRLRVEQDIFAVRQLGREVARAVGMEHQDQTRLATALSEVGRVMLAVGSGADVAFTAEPNGVPTLRVVVEYPLPGGSERVGPQLTQVGRLVDTMEVGDGETGTVVRMARRLPASAPRLTPERMDEIRAGLASHVPGTPLDELHVQNQQLESLSLELKQMQQEREQIKQRIASLLEVLQGLESL